LPFPPRHIQKKQLLIGVNYGDAVGWNVAISSDGSILAVAAPFEDGPNNDYGDVGKVYIYFRDGGSFGVLESYSIEGYQYSDRRELNLGSFSFGNYAFELFGNRLLVQAWSETHEVEEGAVYLFDLTDQGASLNNIFYGNKQAMGNFGIAAVFSPSGDSVYIAQESDNSGCDGCDFVDINTLRTGTVRRFDNI